MSFIQGIGNVASGIYTGADKLLGGVLPGGQDFNQGYIADFGRTIGLPISGGIASIPDSQSIQPVLAAENTSLEDAFATPVESGELTGEGSMGLFDAFGNEGGGFIPPGYNSEAEMIAAGVGDGWTPSQVYQVIDGNSNLKFWEMGNGKYGVAIANEDGSTQSFIQNDITGTTGVSDIDTNNTSVGETNTGTFDYNRPNGIDLGSYLGTVFNGPSAEISVSSESRPLQSVLSGAPLPGMTRIDDTNLNNFLIEVSPIAGGKIPKSQSDIANIPLDAFQQRVIDAYQATSQLDANASNPAIEALKNGATMQQAFGVNFSTSGQDPKIEPTETAPIEQASLAGAFASGGLADGGNPDGNQTGLNSAETQRYLNWRKKFFSIDKADPDGIIDAYSSALADLVSLGMSKEAATKIINKWDKDTSNNINPGGNQTTNNIKTPEMDKISGVDNTQGALSADTLAYDGIHDAIAEAAYYKDLRRKTDEAKRADGNYDKGFDIFTPALLDSDSDLLDNLKEQYAETLDKLGVPQDELAKLREQNTWSGVKSAFNSLAKPFNSGTGIFSTLGNITKGILGIPKNLKKIDEAREVHNINMSDQRLAKKDIKEYVDQLKDTGQQIDSAASASLTSYGLQMAIQDAIFEEKLKDFYDPIKIADLGATLAELKAADALGLNTTITDVDGNVTTLVRQENEAGFNTATNPFGTTTREQDEFTNSTSSPSAFLSGKLADNQNPFNPESQPFQNPYGAEGYQEEEPGWDISQTTNREPETWGVMNDDGRAVAQWNPFAKESVQEKVAQDVVNPGRTASDGYSSPTMATIDRNTRPVLDKVGDLVEYIPETIGMGIYNTVGKLPSVFGRAGRGVGNALATAGQKMDRAIDTNIPNSIFGLPTGDSGSVNAGGVPFTTQYYQEDGVDKANIGVDTIRDWTETYAPGDSPLVELMRDKRLNQGGGQGGGYASGTAPAFMNSTSSGAMGILGGSGAPGLASVNAPVSNGAGYDPSRRSTFNGLGSMLDGFDLSTPEGQAKYADLYGNDRLNEELAKRGIGDRRLQEEENIDPERLALGRSVGDYSVKNRDKKPDPNISEEIGKGIVKAQDSNNPNNVFA